MATKLKSGRDLYASISIWNSVRRYIRFTNYDLIAYSALFTGPCGYFANFSTWTTGDLFESCRSPGWGSIDGIRNYTRTGRLDTTNYTGKTFYCPECLSDISESVHEYLGEVHAHV